MGSQKVKDASKEQNDVPAYVGRMIAEGKALRAKTYALSGYLNGNSSQGLAAEKRVLMAKQLNIMEQYNEVLADRIVLEQTVALK
jgi:hypothetical protein